MATGTVKWFAQALADLMNKQHDLDSDDLRIAIVTAATVPAVATAAPHFGGTGTTNFATTQVATAGTSYTGPVALANKSISLGATGPTFRADVVSLAQDAAGFANGAWGIIYNNTDASKRALAFVELSAAGAASLVSGPVSVDWFGGTNDVLDILAA